MVIETPAGEERAGHRDDLARLRRMRRRLALTVDR